MAQTIRAFQIYYDAATRARLDAGFEALDNTANQRPDWFEYWPIRSFLATHCLDDACYYGFLSPNFHAKTLLTCSQDSAFVERVGAADRQAAAHRV